jgi:hypothetical protein
MLRNLLVLTAAMALPISVVAVSSGVAGAKGKAPTAATDTARCTGISATVSFSIPLTNNGVPSGTDTTTVNGSLSGCTIAGAFGPVAISGASVSGSFAGKPGSAKRPAAQCTGLLGASKEKGSTTVSWSSSPGVPPTTITLKTATGGVATDGNASFSVAGKYKGSFGGADKGKSSTINAETTQSTGTLAGECGGSGISSLSIQKVVGGGDPIILS